MANHLEALPIELLHQITSYLLPSHAPDRSILDHEPHSPLIDLASSSHTLQEAVETYCRTTLLQWSSVTRFGGKMPKTKRPKTTHRGILLKWKKSHCVWCGKKSVRKAVLATGFGCCAECDKKHWPDKITKTNAKRQYHLSEEHLFPEKGDGWPIISYGSYSVEGGIATMFSRADVERLANAVHGDWKTHMGERNAKSAVRRRRMLERKEHQENIETGTASAVQVVDLTGDNDDNDNNDNDD